ncbi:MAG: aldo/keto reductase [Clostridia bacterium]|nr:aldo/keto reductase [Clostridia bacterium]
MNNYVGASIPKLGFGLMRLPMIGEEIDIEQTKKMVDLFLERGFTYFDSAYVYLGGRSEEVMGEAIVKRYPREKFQLATKLPLGDPNATLEQYRAIFQTELDRTGAGYFDFYLLHSVSFERIDIAKNTGAWELLREVKEKGLAKHIGFSYHDTAEKLDQLLTEHPEAEFVQLQINYADWDDPQIQSCKCLEVAKKHGKGVIVMEPLRGGLLADPLPEIRALLEKANPEVTPANWGIRFAASQDNIITVLSGMSNMAQMEDNTAFMQDFQPLNENENAVIKEAVSILRSVPTIPCTACRYCVDGCPQQLNIPELFKCYNSNLVYKSFETAKKRYMSYSPEGRTASTCIGCGQCESQCPQQIPIIERLKEVAAVFE